MTESAYFSSEACKTCYDDIGLKKYEIIATLDSRTSDICNDQHGKIYDLKEWQVGETAPPFHPLCRTTIAPVVEGWEEEEVEFENKSDKDIKPHYREVDIKLEEEFQYKSDEVYKHLNDEERKALSEYTQGGYLDINLDLAKNNWSPYEKGLNSAIDKYTIDYDIITYRGTEDIYFKNLNPGDEYVGGVFYSTSIDYVQAKVFADDATEYSEDGSKGMLLEIRVRKGSKALYIGNNTDYKPNGYTVNEKELLLSNKTKYRIIKKEDFKMILEVI